MVTAGTVQMYRWNARADTIWHVCARFLLEAGYADVPDFVEQTRAANPVLKDWQALPDQTIIILPYLA